jgi:ribosomal protein L37E
VAILKKCPNCNSTKFKGVGKEKRCAKCGYLSSRILKASWQSRDKEFLEARKKDIYKKR